MMKQLSRRSLIKGAAALVALPLTLQAKPQTQQSLKFVHITDSHMDFANPDSVEAMELMVAFLNENYKELDFVLFGGDNFNNNATKSEDALKFKQIIEKLHCPSYVVRGNKESSPKGDKHINSQEFKELFVAGKNLTTNNLDWLLEIKGYNILGLDSCIDGANNGRYTQETLAFAEKTLQNKKPTVILNHHPYTNYWKTTDKKEIHKYVLGNTQETQQKLFRYHNLILTLSGHKHIDSVTQINNAKVIATRGFTRPLDLDNYPMRYVELSGASITEKLIYTA